MSGHALQVEALDVLIILEVTGDELAEAVRGAWRDAATQEDGNDQRHRRTLTVALSDEAAEGTDVTGSDMRNVLHRLSSAVTLAALDARAGELLMLHAAALADPASGATAVLVAASGTGKTTASIALGTELVYLSDETAGIAPDGRIARYRKPLSIVGSDHLKAQVSPSELGLRVDEVEGRVKTVIYLERDPDHTGFPTVEHVNTVDAFALIAPQASALARTAKPLHRMADVFESTGGIKRVRYAEAAGLLPLIRVLLSEEHS